MNVLIIGSGGREHALTWKVAQSSHVQNIFIAPGNPGTAQHGHNVPIDPMDFKALAEFIVEQEVDMVIIGPEAPLVGGLRDFLENRKDLSKLTIIGPGKAGAMLEGSKDFAKSFMIRHQIPTARYGSFDLSSLQEGLEFLRNMKAPYVIKADGLAAGKGVIIAETLPEAEKVLRDMLERKKFGKAGSVVVIEEFLKGVELSVFVLTDGKHYKILPEAKDYKRIGDGDKGPNTGGMGAISPVPFAGPDFMMKVEEQVIQPTIRGLQADGIAYEGFIFIGLMNVNGNPYVIEYNVRMGDPETEVVMPRIKSDIIDLFEGIGNDTLSESDLVIDDRFAATVMIVAGGYPGDYEKGKLISGLDLMSGSVAFHAGTSREGENIYSNGGRVLAITSFGRTLEDALSRSYGNAGHIHFDGMYYRKDIGQDLM
jgi:phosphoribosylamine--glycine ligase